MTNNIKFGFAIALAVLALLTLPISAQVTPSVYLLQGGPLTAASASCLATNCVRMPVVSAAGSVTMQLAGSFVGTVQFEGSVDGTNYIAIPALPMAGGSLVTSATAVGIWQANAVGLRGIQVRVSAYTSGTVAATLTRSPVQPVINALTLPAALSVSSLAASGAVSGATGAFTTSAASPIVEATGAHAEAAAIQSLTEVTTIAAAASSATTLQIPANSIVLGVSVRVTTVIPTATNFTVTGTSSSTVFDTAAVSVAATSVDPGTKSCPYYNASAQTITITPDQSPNANTGRVRVTVFYIAVTPPQS